MMRSIVALLLSLPTVASAATVCVNTTGTGGCFPTIQQGVDAAVSGDVVDVAAGTYFERVVVPSGKRIRLQGAGPAATLIDGGGGGTVLKVQTPNQGITVTGVGIQNGRRGVSLGERVKIDVSDCAITGNIGGGGLRGGGGGTHVKVTRCTITGNSSKASGGGIGIAFASQSVPRMKVIASTIRGNVSARSGGGIAVFPGNLVLVGSSVDDNSAADGGGGIFASDLIARDSTISRNTSHGANGTSAAGGGAYAAGNVTIRNSTISGNVATSGSDQASTGLGGGLLVDGRGLLEHVTLANNTAGAAGGGIYIVEHLTLTASLIGDNSAPYANDCWGGQGVLAVRSNLIEDTTSCAVGTSQGGVVINADPLLGPLQSNGGTTETQALLAGSPAIGAVTRAALCKAPDQRGVTRAVPCDLGSYEAP